MDSYSCCKPNSVKSKQMVLSTTILKLIAEENRLRILCLLMQGEHCVCEIEDHINQSQSLISHHLRDLRSAELIKDEKRGLNVYYSLTKKGKEITDLALQIK